MVGLLSRYPHHIPHKSAIFRPWKPRLALHLGLNIVDHELVTVGIADKWRIYRWDLPAEILAGKLMKMDVEFGGGIFFLMFLGLRGVFSCKFRSQVLRKFGEMDEEGNLRTVGPQLTITNPIPLDGPRYVQVPLLLNHVCGGVEYERRWD